MNDQQRRRYSRQILLPDLAEAGQERLLAARVVVVGLGGLGSPVAMYLAAAGVGTLVLADFDAVDLSNLQRQILHDTNQVGRAKVDSACDALARLNPDTELIGVKSSIRDSNLPDLIAGADAVVDASDNFATRFALNQACFRAGIPLISGAAARAEGQVSVFPGRPGGPCYRCLYPEDGLEEACALVGVLAPVVGIVGSIQATETLKVLTAIGSPLVGRLLLLDALAMQWRSVRIAPDPACPVCAMQ